MWPAPPKQVEREKRDTPAIAILRIERPLGFELIEHLEPKQREKNRGSHEPPRERLRAMRFVETGTNEQGFHLRGSVAAWEQVASLWDGRARLSRPDESDAREIGNVCTASALGSKSQMPNLQRNSKFQTSKIQSRAGARVVVGRLCLPENFRGFTELLGR